MIKKRFIILIIAIMVIIILTGCTKKECTAITVLLDWTPNTNHTGLYVAKDLGYFKDEGLDVDIIQASEVGCADLIAAGKGQFGISSSEQVLVARTSKNPLPIKAIAAITQHNTSGFASLKDKNIKTPKDFENKTYGGWGLPMEEAMLKGLMKKYDADFKKLKMVNSGAVDFITNISKNVDFGWIFYGWDGIAAELQKVEMEFVKLGDIDPVMDYYTPVIISGDSYLDENPEIAKKFLKAATKGYEYSSENPVEAAKILLEAAPEIGEEMAITSQKYLSKEYLADAAVWGYMKKEVWENFGNWMLETGLIEKTIDIDGAYTNEFLPK
jgi:ABC-type nitrate/sulfonate/bicarbonate transport system substrate-binding protein